MTISLRTHKILWGWSGGKCAICKNDLIIDPTSLKDAKSVVGDEAHIIARKESFTRGDYDSLSPDERDQYPNLILLCKIHHKQIDDQPAHFTVEKLREIKKQHEEEVKSRWTDKDSEEQEDEILYAGYVDEWQMKADLNNWRNTSSWLSDDTPTLPRDWYDAQKEFLIWILGRIWSGRYPLLEGALLNYGVVLGDFLTVFDRHLDRDREGDAYIRTHRFYRIDYFDSKRYHELVEQYEAHVCLVSDLFFELTRASNLICDKVRETIFRGYRLKEGAVLIERHSVGYELKTVRARLEYRGDERIRNPYPGLEEFKTIRYSRDYALDPSDPQKPGADEDDL